MRIFKLKTGEMKKKGFYLPVVMMASVLFLAYAATLSSFAMANVKTANLHNKQITAMSIAESGINYYMWHLAHSNEDYCDGQACLGSNPYGPYEHQYKDQSGQTLGTYELYIYPPEPGRAVVRVKSIGKVEGKSPRRTLIAELGVPSLTKYTLLANGSQLTIGTGEKIDGSAHANGSCLYNQGEITGDASSTESTFNGTFGLQPGVAGPGTFGGEKLFPVPPVNFSQINVDITKLRNEVRDLGQGQYYDSSGQKGYHLVLGTDSYNLYRVKKYDNTGLDITQESLIGTYSYPQQGLIFLEDNLWLGGTIANKQITIVAADPEAGLGQKKRIIIPASVKYTNYNGNDKIGLITQTDILVSRNAPTSMEIDAAMIAKDGLIKIENYGEVKNKIRVYGSMAHNGGLLWQYTSGQGQVVSGYQATETVTDPFNVSDPPPKFPATGVYSILSWREE